MPATWPSLSIETWPDTQATLHRLVQIVGKLRLDLSPPENHFWHSTLYVTSRGLTTSAIPYGSDIFQVDFDFLDHRLLIQTSRGDSAALTLAPRPVAEFYAEILAVLRGLGIEVHIWARPVEITDTTPFEQDTVHRDYDPTAANACWRALVQADRVFKQFRGRFLGKASPVHFFWGAFDLAVTRFSGRLAPMWNGQALNVDPHVMHVSYSHEVSSGGFFLGGAGAEPFFYSYAVPEPSGFRDAHVEPAAAYDGTLGEFVLPYEAVRSSDQPDDLLMNFLESTYRAAADLGGWDRVLLEQQPPCVCDARDTLKNRAQG